MQNNFADAPNTPDDGTSRHPEALPSGKILPRVSRRERFEDHLRASRKHHRDSIESDRVEAASDSSNRSTTSRMPTLKTLPAALGGRQVTRDRWRPQWSSFSASP